MFILSPDPNSAPNYIVLLFFSSPFSLFIHFIIATVHYRTNSGVSAMRTATSSFSCHLLIQGFCDSVCELIVVNINFRLKLSRMFVTLILIPVTTPQYISTSLFLFTPLYANQFQHCI